MGELLSRANRTPENDDYIYLTSNEGLSDGKQEFQNFTMIPETTRTVNFTNSQTASQINADIDAVGRYIPKGVVITFQFANGTYNLDATLYFDGFYGGGRFEILGDTSQTNGLHTNHNVHLNFNNSTNGVYTIHNSTNAVVIRHLKITCQDGYRCITLQRPGYSEVYYNYLIHTGNTSSSSRGVDVGFGMNLFLLNNYFNGSYYAVTCFEVSKINSSNNDDTGTLPKYGLRCALASDIGKNGTQPAGSTANELVNLGGQIR
jgi:hypothetical protein